jgi:uncharacterized integral membrane protein (TIGR00698 family)
MEEERTIDLSGLWKKEDWMSVWIGFAILIVFLAGVSIALPKWQWMTDGTFGNKTAQWLAKLEPLLADAKAHSETGLAEAGASLKTALEAKDRNASANAASALEQIASKATDPELGKKIQKVSVEVKGAAGASLNKVMSGANLANALYILVGFWVLSAIGMLLMGESIKNFSMGFPIVFVLSALSFLIAGNSMVSYYGLEVVFWALLIGLIISNTVGIPVWLKTAVKTEFFIKIGLVLLGAEVLFTTIAKVGAYGMVQAVLVIFVIFYFCFWISRKFGLDDEFAAILASAVSICGVSAAIAAGGAVQGDQKKVSHAISLVLLCAIPMLIFQPLIAKVAGMSAEVAGAWIGGTIDTTGAVVAAGAIAGPAAMAVAVVVKMAQNVLIGVAAFIMAVWFSFKGQQAGQKPSLMEIWYRFPKFVVGFIVASVFFSFFLSESTAKAVTGITSNLRGWWFTLAFLCIGLETKFKELVAMGGGRPAAAFLVAQAANIFWTLLLAYLIFGGILFKVPAFK